MVQRLADEHAIERIAVEGRKLGKACDARLIEHQIGDPMSVSLARQVGLG